MTAAEQSTVNRRVAPISKLWWVGLVAAGVAAIANVIFYWMSSAVGIPYLIPVQGPDAPLEPLPTVAVIIATIIPTVVATILFGILGRFLSNPVRVFVIISVVVLVASFAMPFTLPAAVALSTKIALNVMHVVAAVVIVGVLIQLGSE